MKCRHCGEWLDPNSRPPWAVDLTEIGRRLCEAVEASAEASASDAMAEPPGLGVPMPQPERSWDEQTDPGVPELPRTPTSLFGGSPSQELDIQPPSDEADAAAAAAAAARTLDRPASGRRRSSEGHDTWTAPAWLSRPPADDRGSSKPPPPPPEPAVQSEEVTTAAGDPTTLEEVALRMERVKASAAVVRDALRDTDTGAEARAPETPHHAEPDLLSSPAPATRRRAATPPPRPGRNSQAAELAAGFFGEADASVAESLAAEASLASTGDAFGSMVGPAPRPIPWAPIIVGGLVVAAIGIYTFRSQLFAEPAPPVVQQQSAQVPSAPAKQAALGSTSPVADAAAKAGEGKPVQPEPGEGTGGGAQPPPEDDAKARGETGAAAEVPGSDEPAVLDPADLEKLEEARKLYKHQKLKKASELLGEILEAHPRQGEALLLMAQVQLEEAEFDSSLDTASTCVEVDPQLADCWLTIGVLQQNRQDKEAAVAAYEKYLALAPEGSYARDVRTQLKRLNR